MIRLEKISYSYSSDIKVFKDVDLEINNGEKIVVIGANGSGKSTLLHIIGALKYPQSGKYYYKGKLIDSKTIKEKDIHYLIRSEIGYLFQNPDTQLFCTNVFEELAFAPRQLGLSKEECDYRVNSIMEFFKIAHLKERSTYLLSGGEKKRLLLPPY
ncbi:MAG: energy-coupling factor ABC transporter ATP-binding protein [Elusimicrobiota bacterium]